MNANECTYVTSHTSWSDIDSEFDAANSLVVPSRISATKALL